MLRRRPPLYCEAPTAAAIAAVYVAAAGAAGGGAPVAGTVEGAAGHALLVLLCWAVGFDVSNFLAYASAVPWLQCP